MDSFGEWNSGQLFYTIKIEETFQEAFQKMSKEQYQYGVKLEYLLVLIAFSLSLDMDMLKICNGGWYSTDLHIELICMAFRKVDIDPGILKNGKVIVVFSWLLFPSYSFVLIYNKSLLMFMKYSLRRSH